MLHKYPVVKATFLLQHHATIVCIGAGPSTEGGMETNCLQVGPGGKVFPP